MFPFKVLCRLIYRLSIPAMLLLVVILIPSNACVFSPFCVQNNSKCTLATKAEMWRETMRKGVERWKSSRKKGAVLRFINLQELREKRGAKARFLMSWVGGRYRDDEINVNAAGKYF